MQYAYLYAEEFYRVHRLISPSLCVSFYVSFISLKRLVNLIGLFFVSQVHQTYLLSK